MANRSEESSRDAGEVRGASPDARDDARRVASRPDVRDTSSRAPAGLARAIAIAAEAHDGQFDKAGAPYILHPLRVMLRMQTETERIVAVLHDVVEDGPGWSFERLRAEGFADDVLDALAAVTKRPEDEDGAGDPPEVRRERYLAFVRRAAAHPVGRRVKRADLEDNCDLSRIPAPGPQDHARVAKYREAIALLETVD